MDISNLDSEKTPLQNVKQRFFALRNGALADMLRKAGSPYSIIFGLNLPQIREIAAAFGTNPELAEQLWNNQTTRESRLLAPMLIDKSTFSENDAARWLSSLNGTSEEADILSHTLLRHLPFTKSLTDSLTHSDEPIKRYIGLRLLLSSLTAYDETALQMANIELERDEALTRPVALQIVDEISYLKENR